MTEESESPTSPAAGTAAASRGRSAPRSKKGCWTCRERKVKCDEARPTCRRCQGAHRECTYVIPEGRRKRVYLKKALSPGPDGLLSHDSAATVVASSTSAEDARTAAAAADSAATDENKVLTFYKKQYLSSISTKSPAWSFFSGVIHLGHTNLDLMNMIIANARSQDRRHGREGDGSGLVDGFQHYQNGGGSSSVGGGGGGGGGGLYDFASLLTSGEFDPLTILSTLFLLIQFELRHGEKAEDVQRHFHSFTAAVSTHGHLMVPVLRSFLGIADHPDAETPYPNVQNRLALWIAYMDAIASTWDLGGSVIETFWDRYPASLEHMFFRSRDALKEIWGRDYPPSEALDDLQNRPAFDFFHQTHLLRYRVTLFRWSVGDPEKAAHLYAEIQTKIEQLHQQHAVLIDNAARWPNPTAQTPRIVLNLRFIVSSFYAVIVDFYRAANPYYGRDTPGLLAKSLTAILQIATIVHENEGPNSMCRIAWPLFVVGVETVDFAHQSWILSRFRELAETSLSFRRAHTLLKAVIAQQRHTGEKVDYRRWIKERHGFEAFII